MTTDVSKEETARRAEADAEGLFEQLYAAEDLPNAASLESNPVIQRLPSSVEQVEDISILAPDGSRVTVSPDKVSQNDLNQYPRNSVEGGDLTYAGKTITGKRVVFRTDTGKPVEVLTYILPVVLRKKRDDGMLAFTLRDPGFRPPKGDFPCFLNAKAPESEAFHRMGLPACDQDALPSAIDRDDHMIHRHTAEWRRIEDIRIRAERKEDREINREMKAALVRNLPNQDIPSSSDSSPTETVSDFRGGHAVEKLDKADKSFMSSCAHCDKTTKGHTQRQSDHFMQMHEKSHANKDNEG